MQPPFSFQTTDVIYLQKIKCQYPKLYLKTTIALEYIPDKCPKKIDKGSRRAIRFRGHKGTPRTPLPQWFNHPAEAHSPGYSLMQQSDYCRTEESTTLDPQWFHQSLPNCNPTCNAA